MAWRIEFDPATEKDLRRLDKTGRSRVIQFLRERIAPVANPRTIGQALRGPHLGGLWKYRVGDLRIICDIRDREIRILVVRVGHRASIYRT